MKKRCIFKNTELLNRKFKESNFVICYGGHMANYEYLVSFPLSMPQYGMCHLYLADPYEQNSICAQWVLSCRSRYGAVNIPTYSPLRTLIELKKQFESGTCPYEGYLFGTLADMDTYDNDPHSAPFFGRVLEVKTGSERIGRKMNMSFVFASIRSPKRGYYEIEFVDMQPRDVGSNPFAYTDEFVRLLEKNISEQPELWMQWGSPRF